MNWSVLLVALFTLSISQSYATTVRGTACPGVGNTPTPYQIMLVKQHSGTMVVSYFVNGLKYPLASKNAAAMARMNPDWSFTKGAVAAVMAVLPLGRLSRIIYTGSRAASNLSTTHSPRASHGEQNHNGMTLALMEICLASVYRGLEGGQGVMLNLSSHSQLNDEVDLLREVMGF